MRYARPISLFAASALGMIAAPATAAPWWYAGHDDHRVVFVDVGSIQHVKGFVTFSSKRLIRKQDDPVAMTVNYMQADCAKRQLGWIGMQQFGHDEAVIATSTRPRAEMAAVSADKLATAELAFACSEASAREADGDFPLTVDDAAFTDALLHQADRAMSPRALHDRMAADTSVPAIRSTAPDPSTFGKVQTVKLGEPLVPPRDYAKGPQVPNPKDYDSIEVGRIYDVAYQGIKDGQIQFEIRGYSIDDLVHPGSGQIQPADLRDKKVNILSLAITIIKALPDRITYAVAIEQMPPVEPLCPPGGCGEPVDTPAETPTTSR